MAINYSITAKNQELEKQMEQLINYQKAMESELEALHSEGDRVARKLQDYEEKCSKWKTEHDRQIQKRNEADRKLKHFKRRSKMNICSICINLEL